ncbi:MAG: hypothetical protein BMS9Abin12_0693 [Acidimicrobiia bacterium]|nr:MAG: hypothetical protein BMS9Abin12_0693 [Acidimicrobiia bacterium]
MISASIAETHRFGRVRRNGYDPAEVDAVMARLVDALRRNDDRMSSLTEKLDAADASADAIRRTFVAAENTRDEILDDAYSEADEIIETARRDATELSETTSELQCELAAGRTNILAEIYADAEQRMLEIENQAANRSADAEWAIHEAIAERDRTVSETEADAQVVRHRIEGRTEHVRARLASMEQAALTLEKAAVALAEATQEGAKVIDLAAIEQMSAQAHAVHEPEVVSDPETIVEEKPHLAIAMQTDGAEFGESGPKTRYQRSTGVPLKERIKIARMSG